MVGILLLSDEVQYVQPNNGPLEGGNVVALSGTNISDGSPGDILNVTLDGVPVARIISFDRDHVYVEAGTATVAGTGHVVVTTRSRGISMKNFGYTYNPRGRIDDWSINNDMVLISGINLGNGSDISMVRLLGVEAAIWLQSETAVYVQVGAATSGSNGTIEIESASHGLTTATGFTYPPPAPASATLSTTTASRSPAPDCRQAKLSAVTPGAVSIAGGDEFLLSGEQLAQAVTGVTLAGIPAEIIAQTDAALVVRAGTTDIARTGDVVVRLAGCGALVLENAIQYTSD